MIKFWRKQEDKQNESYEETENRNLASKKVDGQR